MKILNKEKIEKQEVIKINIKKDVTKQEIIEFLKSNSIFIIGTILIIYKAILMEYIIGLKITMKAILFTISIATLIMSPTINNKNKFSYIYLNVIYALLTILIYANFLYYSYTTNFISFYQIDNLRYAEDIGSGLTLIINLKNILLFWIDNILLLILSILAHKNTKNISCENNTLKKALVVIFLILNIFFIEKPIKAYYKEKSYNKSELVENTSIYFYHIEDAKEYIENCLKKEEVNKEKLEKAYNKNLEEKAIQTEYTGIAKGSNVIILQLESLNEYIIGKEVNGKEITPNLNEFFRQNIYCSQMYNQGLGSTADSEFEMANSMYPIENGYVFQKYHNNAWLDIYSTLKNKGYYTSFMHPNTSTYWNRDAIYNIGYKIDEYNDIKDFPNIERAGGFYSDEGFLDEAINKINSYEGNFITTLVSVTTHTPFNLNGVSNLSEKLTLKVEDVEKYSDVFGRYLLCNNFVDYAFGKFIKKLEETGLMENTILVVYGDHGAGLTCKEDVESFFEENGAKYTEFEEKTKIVHVPFGIKIPNVNESKYIESTTSKIDIKPTILDLLGVENDFAIGNSIFSNKDYTFIKDLGYITSQNYYFNGKYYNKQTEEEIEQTKELEEIVEKMEEEFYLSDTIIKNNLFRNQIK